MPGIGRGLGAALAAGLVTASARRALGRRTPGGADRWTRTNHRGEPISLLEGPAVATGLAAGALVAGGTGRVRAAGVLAAVGAGTFGLVDDLAEDTATRTKGLRGHLGALARGTLTTGGLKVLGIGATSLAAAALAGRGRGVGRVVDAAVDGALVAGTANLFNLLDLRPGRALKAAGVASVLLAPTASGATTGAVLGSAGAAAAADLGERDMLGDCGANALGAVVGMQIVTGTPRAVRLAALAGVVGLTLASERVSFSRVIEGNDVLRRVDSWGRRAPVDERVADAGTEGTGA